MAKQNDGAPGSDGVTFEAVEEQGVESFLEQIQDELANIASPIASGQAAYDVKAKSKKPRRISASVAPSDTYIAIFGGGSPRST